MPEVQGRVTLWGIEVFLAVAEEGAISAAAKRLGVSPSAISQQLTGLETALGAVLLDRSARPMRPTPAGAMFRRHAQTILNAEAEARAELGLADLSGLTTLRLGMIEDFDAEVTPRLLSALAQDLKGCRFLLETGASHRLLDQLESRALDMVVAADLGSEAADDGWREVHPLLAEPFLAVTPKGRTPDDLPLIQYTARHLMGRQIASHLARLNLRLAHRFELDSYNAILAMVAGGQGWTILTPLALHQAARFRGAVDVAPLPFAPLERTLSLSARAGVLRDVPAQVAAHLTRLIEDAVVAPARAEWPWLGVSLRVL
ncbi:MAG: LysR family transcriptional regulator [Rhodobacterales bacterium RIFCSPHIGHO2_02_FULL_62_130]|jgi:DNA-binding transcriptional LysR family regulator|nr:MAG: LysR family transcriptional regulator [Rhodobacterales bacterium RIFCSPHIGHO2_02_FULL_62_130]OHC55218.1 MAG: LysR family transcriptional regulator [Rhodobacterales bacterium RIFCSPHIGHO2_12_FULL_62_75]HCZ00413.1 LysR family transcriptional regulator [Rhodobacter sp.]